jgi:hypothetical protein
MLSYTLPIVSFNQCSPETTSITMLISGEVLAEF